MLERSREINAYQQAQVARNGRVRQKKNRTAETKPPPPPLAAPTVRRPPLQLSASICRSARTESPAARPSCRP